MVSIYTKPKQGSTCRSGLEVYKTDEDNFTPYVSTGATSVTSDSSDDSSSSSSYSYHRGDITEVYYYGGLESISHEYDYSDMSNNFSFNLEDVDKTRFYKGVRVCLKKSWESPDKLLEWDDLTNILTGFISEQTFSEKGVEVKVDGLTKLLDAKYSFEFSNMKRSRILEEIIRTAGLTPVVDTTGLDDDVTSFSTKSETSSSSESSGTGTGSDDLDKVVDNAINGKSTELEKAKAIDSAFKNAVYYKYYFDCRHSTVEAAWKNKHLNCADGANVLCAMFIRGNLDAVIIHVTGHYIVRVKADGKTYYTDNAASTGSHTTRAFGKTWGPSPSTGSEVGTKISS